jgi:hypothetical protein
MTYRGLARWAAMRTWNWGTLAFTWPGANRGYAIPFVVEIPYTVKRMFWGNGGTISGNIDIGIYGIDFSLLVSAGGVAQSGASTYQVSDVTDTLLEPGRYLLAISVDNTTATYQMSNTGGGSYQPSMLGCTQMSSAYPLPSTWVPTKGTDQTFPWAGFTNQTLP